MFILALEGASTVWFSSTDFGATRQSSVPNVDSFTFTADTNVLAQVRNDLSSKILWISDNAGKTFNQMKFTPTRANVSTLYIISLHR